MVVFEHAFEGRCPVAVVETDLEALWLVAGDPGPRAELPAEPWDEAWFLAEAAGPITAPAPAPGSASAEAWAVPGVPRPAAGPAVLLGELGRVLDALEAAGPLSGSRADTAGLWRARGLALRELAEMDATGRHQTPGGRPTTTASWLRGEVRLTDPAVRAAVHLAVGLRDDLPALGVLLRQGEVTVEHAGAVLGGVRGLDRQTVTDASDGLCALAGAADPTEVRRRLRDLACAVDDRLAAQAERRARERAGLRLAQVGGHTAVDGTLAGEDGATVRLAMALAVEAARQAGDERGKAGPVRWSV